MNRGPDPLHEPQNQGHHQQLPRNCFLVRSCRKERSGWLILLLKLDPQDYCRVSGPYFFHNMIKYVVAGVTEDDLKEFGSKGYQKDKIGLLPLRAAYFLVRRGHLKDGVPTHERHANEQLVAIAGFKIKHERDGSLKAVLRCEWHIKARHGVPFYLHSDVWNTMAKLLTDDGLVIEDTNERSRNHVQLVCTSYSALHAHRCAQPLGVDGRPYGVRILTSKRQCLIQGFHRSSCRTLSSWRLTQTLRPRTRKRTTEGHLCKICSRADWPAGQPSSPSLLYKAHAASQSPSRPCKAYGQLHSPIDRSSTWP
jgi:hypothetical protein